MPRISVIMPSYNQAAFLADALESALSQQHPNFECIVIDGGSTDGSVDIIRSYEDRLSYWVSEPDDGQSHAMNKGFARARGSILTWLNSDDILLPGALQRVAEAAWRFPRCQWFAGNTVLIDAALIILGDRSDEPVLNTENHVDKPVVI